MLVKYVVEKNSNRFGHVEMSSLQFFTVLTIFIVYHTEFIFFIFLMKCKKIQTGIIRGAI